MNGKYFLSRVISRASQLLTFIPGNRMVFARVTILRGRRKVSLQEMRDRLSDRILNNTDTTEGPEL
jgi:hypothetical protein